MISANYTMHLYCDFPDDTYRHQEKLGRGEFVGRTHAECKREAQGVGWKFHRDGLRVICPTCVAAKRKLPRE